MYSRITVTATTLLGALVSKSLAQSCEYSDEYSCDPYGSDPYGTPTYTGHGNALTEYPDLESLLAVIAPQVTSISPDQVRENFRAVPDCLTDFLLGFYNRRRSERL